MLDTAPVASEGTAKALHEAVHAAPRPPRQPTPGPAPAPNKQVAVERAYDANGNMLKGNALNRVALRELKADRWEAAIFTEPAPKSSRVEPS